MAPKQQQQQQQVMGIDIGLRNLAVCVLCKKEEEEEVTIKHWQVYDILEGGNMPATCALVHPVAEAWLDELFPSALIRSMRHVAVEAQPGGKFANAKPTLFSHLLLSHLRRIQRTDLRLGDALVSVQHMAPSKKFRTHNTGKVPTNYAKRKALSVQLCKALLTNTPMPPCKKEDDLADAFLLAMCALEDDF